MKLRGFGGVVPWIGFRVVRVPCEVAAEAGIRQTRLAEDGMDECYVECLEVEWFGIGCALTMKGVP